MQKTLRSGIKNIHSYKTRSRDKRQLLGQRYTDNQQRILGIDNAIDPRKFETLPSFVVNGRSGSDLRIEYGAVRNGQRSGIVARITREVLHRGQSPQYDFPFFKRKFGLNIVRGHLLAKVLGGYGGANNLVPLKHFSNNQPIYSDIEKRIQDYVAKEGVGIVKISVSYGNNPPQHPRHVLPLRLTYEFYSKFGKLITLNSGSRIYGPTYVDMNW